jgi:hypothetical protein
LMFLCLSLGKHHVYWYPLVVGMIIDQSAQRTPPRRHQRYLCLCPRSRETVT